LQLHLSKFADQGRTALLPALHSTQALLGYIPEQAAEVVGRILGVPLADVHGVIEFYSLFYSEPVGKTILQVCTDPPCALRGGEELLQSICRSRLYREPPRMDRSPSAPPAWGCVRMPCAVEALRRMKTAIGDADPTSLPV
jgi:NADH:ubiquinone oxidoreductase subunit E